MTYDQAHKILHLIPPDPSPPIMVPPLTAGTPVPPKRISLLLKSLQLLTNLARFRKHSRESIGGAIDLSSSSPELKFELDTNGNPVRVTPKEDKEIHHTIAEMMIMANQCVAEKIHEYFPTSSLLRVHKTVDKDTSKLKEVMKTRGISLDETKISTNKELSLASSLQKIQNTESDKNVTSYVQSLATRVLSEAQYVCTEKAPMEGWRHYGLGIDKYTHFTSPIRRYADVVVHRLLLASVLIGEIGLNSKPLQHSHQDDPRKSEKQEQIVIPKSSAISVLKGEGRKSTAADKDSDDEIDDDFLDSLIEDATGLVLDDTESPNQKDVLVVPPKRTASESNNLLITPYGSSEVCNICMNLNHQNRMSKIASMECQSLFLSLYFRENIEITSAVIIDLRSNGLLVYVPKFDLKGAIFLGDKDGAIHIDPRLLGLNLEDGSPPSSSFLAVKEYRKFSTGRLELNNNNKQQDERSIENSLSIVVPEAKRNFCVKTLDVVTVQLSCDTSDSNARIPLPRIHLISKTSKISSVNATLSAEKHMKTKVTSKLVQGKPRNEEPILPLDRESKQDKSSPPSMYQIIHSIEIVPKIKIQEETKNGKNDKKNSKTNRVQYVPGRFIYNSFQNPDTHAATQKAAAEIAMKQRDEYGNDPHRQTKGNMNAYDESKKIEREVTARIQRKIVEKRNTRRSKSGK